ncbi:MAG TPA: MerR family transcriptional regulator [Ktedonobacterales bacterium]|jgi:MerR family transcriptional regulator, light-induced transcriptional regulator|nr:MerR family transcriptional regulator [Ktedonobacterales bacterium]
MNVRPEEPLLSIGTCARMTGLPEATLRVWERRYNFPASSRTSGGHRLYSQEDVLRLQWVKARLAEGMQVSQAIQALRRAEEAQTFQLGAPTQPEQERMHENDAPIRVFNERLREALFKRRMQDASLVLGEALAVYSIEDIILQMIIPSFQDIGEAWANGSLTVATEHLMTNYLRQQLLAWLRLGGPAYAVRPVALACAPEELHEGGLLALGVLLRRLRWPIVYLGQATPLADLSSMIADLAPAIMVFAAMTEETALALADWPRHLSDATLESPPAIGFGGRAFITHPELIEATPGVFLGRTLQEGVEKVDHMLREMNQGLA